MDTLPWRLFIVEHTRLVIGPKRTSLVAPYMPAFGGKADALMTLPMPAFDRLERRLERVSDFAGRAAFHVRKKQRALNLQI